jgi:hypothetical protein
MTAPLAKLLRYYHACVWANGAWTRKAASAEKVASVDEMLAKFVPQTSEEDDYD